MTYTKQTLPLYRSRKGMLLGVCKGIANYFGFSVTGMRLIVIVGSLFTGFWPFLLGYVAAAFIMKPEPIVHLENEADAEFYDSYMSSRSMALMRLKRQFDNLDRRIRRMEDVVTSRDYQWQRRMTN